jgi:sulfate adenylyltransferase subunit 1
MSHQSDLISENIEQYLKEHENKDLLRFITCGSVDDGKSTLIGRLLHDSKMIYEDQLAAIKSDTKKVGSVQEETFDLSLLVDGLQAEREQGITIDVAYRYFSTDKRKFIIADTPGHEQYTRNMATGASTADLAIILIDARHGVLTQTRRHSYIVHLLGIEHVAVAINKMDIVDYDQSRYEAIKADYEALAKQLGIASVTFFPVSALKGDNIVSISEKTPWYSGEPLMQFLETTPLSRAKAAQFRLPVQYVIRPDLSFRGFSGTIASGSIAVGDSITALPSGKTSRVKRIATYDGDRQEAGADEAITIALEDEIDISRGDVLIRSDETPAQVADALEADLVWMSESELDPSRTYLLKLGTRTVPVSIGQVLYQIDVNSYETYQAQTVALNSISRVHIAAQSPLIFDAYEENRQMGGFILIDRFSNATVAAGMARCATKAQAGAAPSAPSAFELELNALVRKHFPHWEAKDIGALLK